MRKTKEKGIEEKISTMLLEFVMIISIAFAILNITLYEAQILYPEDDMFTTTLIEAFKDK